MTGQTLQSLESATEHQPRARAALSAALATRPAHAYLFEGPRGAGKRAVARAFAAEILAGAAPDPDDARRRALLDPSPHPDLVWLAPTGAQHLVEEVRERVIRAAAYRPYEGGKRVFVVEAAEAMRDESQNALLKTLEEPPKFVHLILLSSEPALLLETVASRCQAVPFAPLPSEAVEATLASDAALAAAAEEIAAAARLSRGDVDLARFLLGEEGRKLRADAVAADFKALLADAEAAGEEAEAATREALEAEKEAGVKRSAREIAEEAKRAGRRRRTELLDLGLALSAAWYRDLVAVAVGASDVIYNGDRREELAEGAARLDPGRARQVTELVQDTRRRLDLNVSEELALEALSFRLERTVSDAVIRRPQSSK
jgi:DNA polymerase III subunit delta'